MRLFSTSVELGEEGLRIGRYRVLRRLAVGGMGEVFLARHEGPAGFAKTLVVKRILEHLASDARFVEMFLNEARLAALLSHPNVVQIFELGEDKGSYFIAMEFIPGRSLRAIGAALRQRGKAIEATMAARLAAQALHGLHYAHELKDERGQPLKIVHRDVSPDNILVGFGGAVKMLDFGIAKAVAAAREHTRTLRGKFAYMSPEQLRGDVLDRRADVYSMGVVLYELLTGRLPYTALSPSAILERMAEPPMRPTQHTPELPQELEQIVLIALSQTPSERFQTAEEMAAALVEFASRHSETMSPGQLDGFLKELFGEDAASMVEGHRQRTRALEAPEELVTARSLQGIPPELPLAAPPPALEVPSEHPGSLEPEPDASYTELRKPQAWRRALAFGAPAAAIIGVVLAVALHDSGPAPLTEEELAPERAAAAAAKPRPAEKPAPPPVTAAPAPAPADPPIVEAKPTEARRPARDEASRTATRRPREGKVNVRVHPWAEVIFNGKSYGTTPLPPLSVPAGRQSFVLKNSDLRVEKHVTVVVPAGGEVALTANLMTEPRGKDPAARR